MEKHKPKAPIAYTNTQLVYCTECADEINLLDEGAMPTNWLPFGPIDNVDDLPQKRCDRCETVLREAVRQSRRRMPGRKASDTVPKRRSAPRPSDDVLRDLARACHRNASQLLSEAELLLCHGHSARALALAHTAREEAAKVNLIGDVLEGAFPWAEFDVVFRDHSCKYAYLNRSVTYSDPAGVDAIASYVRSLGGPEFEERQRALFVDLAVSRILEPSVFTREDAAAAIQAGRDELQALNAQLLLTGGTGVRSGLAGLSTVRSLGRPRRHRRSNV